VTTNAARAALLTRALQAALTGDRQVLTDLCTEDIKAWTPALTTSSRDELLDELESADGALSGAEADIVPLDVGGDFACAEWTVTLTHSGPLDFGDGTVLEPTGLRVTLHGVTVAEFRGERICAVRQYADQPAAFERLRAAAGPGTAGD
jgi:ketosteroid isomerase-like protein